MTSRLRLRNYDYAQPGISFVTVCAAHRACLFGEIRHEQMVLSTAGQVIESCWDSLVMQFAGITLDAKVVMPNHLHGIAMLDDGDMSSNLSDMMKWFKAKSTNDYIRGVKSVAMG
ncbi:MAG TPA: hypothetical protein VM450_09960 [Thermomicrobiales bacterium]|nr:hypothetical protein [Thermomicrobiales bacterium]